MLMTLAFAHERIETWPLILARLQPCAKNAKLHGTVQPNFTMLAAMFLTWSPPRILAIRVSGSSKSIGQLPIWLGAASSRWESAVSEKEGVREGYLRALFFYG